MAFKGSITFAIPSATTVVLPLFNDSSGAFEFTQCAHSHVKVSVTGAGAVTTLVFDNRPGITYTSTSIDSDVWAIPTGAKSILATPTTGTAVVAIGRG